MQIISHQIKGSDLDTTYFRMADITPAIRGIDELHIYNGRGTRSGWGSPSVDSQVTQLADDVIRVTVTAWHKHTMRGPVSGNHYFVLVDGQWRKTTANNKRVKEAEGGC